MVCLLFCRCSRWQLWRCTVRLPWWEQVIWEQAWRMERLRLRILGSLWAWRWCRRWKHRLSPLGPCLCTRRHWRTWPSEQHSWKYYFASVESYTAINMLWLSINPWRIKMFLIGGHVGTFFAYAMISSAYAMISSDSGDIKFDHIFYNMINQPLVL